MASNRVLIMRIAGCGDDAVGQYVFTSRAGLSYLGSSEVPGVIADMSQQFTSEIGMFAAMGSDPTTGLSLLTTETTLRVCNSRAQIPVRNSAGAMVTVETYVQPDPLMQFDVSDGTLAIIADERMFADNFTTLDREGFFDTIRLYWPAYFATNEKQLKQAFQVANATAQRNDLPTNAQ